MPCKSRPLNCNDPEAKYSQTELERLTIVVLVDEDGNDVLDERGNKMFAKRMFVETCDAAAGSGA